MDKVETFMTTPEPNEWRTGSKSRKAYIIHKDKYPHIKLPKYIDDSLEAYGNTYVKDKIYKKLGIEGVEQNVYENFNKKVKCHIGEYGDCVIELKGKKKNK